MSRNVINLAAHRKSKERLYAERNAEKLKEAWEKYDEIEKLVVDLPLPIILKVMTLCRKRLKELDG